jgi:phage baseplate assembly protein W
MKAIKIPFQFNGGKTVSTTSPSTIAEQKIVNVLVTNEFERVMRHKYGVGIQQFLFEPMDDLFMVDFTTDAIADIKSNVSRVDIMDIKISPTDSVAAYGNTDTTLGITVVYRLPLGSPQLVKFDIAVPGYLTEDTTI